MTRKKTDHNVGREVKTETLKGFGPQARSMYLEHVRNGMQRGAAAEALGLDRKKVREWIATHLDYLALVEDAELDATEHVQEAIYHAAINGSVPAAKVWLELRGMVSTAAMPEARTKASQGSPAARGGDPFADLDNVSPLEHARAKRERGA